MHLPSEINGADTFGLREPDVQDGRLPAGAGFLMIVSASLLFWLFVLLIFSHA